MEDKSTNQEEISIDLQRIFTVALQKAWLIVILSIVGAILAFAVTTFFITPKYQSTAMFYVNNSSISVGNASVSLSSGDLSTSRNLVESYIVILNTRESLLDVIDYAGVNRTYAEVQSMITANAVNETEIFEVVVTSTDPQEAEKIANAIAYILPKRIGTIIDGTSAKVVDSAIVPTKPSSPSYSTNTVIGFMLGFVITFGVISLREIFDTTIRTEEDVTQNCAHPILTSVPDMTAPSKGNGYYYGYSSNRRTKRKVGLYSADKQPGDELVLIGDGISFEASEAYKLLRTKLQFSFSNNKNCQVIGLSSAMSGEGKSLTAANLAYTLAQLNKKVILLDCDMRRPTMAEKLKIAKWPGLSSYLTNQNSLNELIQRYGKSGEIGYDVIAAGQTPPNPIELLSSDRMSDMLANLRNNYDYVILDLPPVGEVSDAMAVAKETDGMLLVVRQNYCNRPGLVNAVHQFEFIQSKILGVIFNCTSEHGVKYGKGYYRKYYKYRYNRSGAKAHENAK